MIIIFRLMFLGQFLNILARLFVLVFMSFFTLHATNVQKPVSLDVSLPLEMKQGSSFAFAVQATFDDDSVRVVDANVTSGNPDVIGIDVNQSLLALDEGNATVAVSYGELTVQQLISVYFEIHGHRLPPEPDPEENKATLLGIDVNENGVRDDVERWIYLTEDKAINQATLMFVAKSAQKVMYYPEIDAIELEKIMSRASSCMVYIQYSKKHELVYKNENNWVAGARSVRDFVFNTPARAHKYLTYDAALSGGVYEITPSWKLNDTACDFNISKVLEGKYETPSNHSYL